MFNDFLTWLAIRVHCHPLLSKIVTVLVTGRFLIDLVSFIESNFTDFFSIIFAIGEFLFVYTMLFVITRKQHIIYSSVMEYFVDNQNKTITDEELRFFRNEADKNGFLNEFNSYIDEMDEKPLIKDCMMKCMELSKLKIGMCA